jgi:hypothetical protein
VLCSGVCKVSVSFCLNFYFSLQQEKALSIVAINLEVYVNFCKFTLNEVKDIKI